MAGKVYEADIHFHHGYNNYPHDNQVLVTNAVTGDRIVKQLLTNEHALLQDICHMHIKE